MKLNIEESFYPYIESALMRFQYLYPEINIERDGLIISFTEISKEDFFALKQEIFHLIYKEKIYQETLDIRVALYQKISND